MEIESKSNVSRDKTGVYLAFVGGIIATIVAVAWIIKTDIHSVEVRLADKLNTIDGRLVKFESAITIENETSPEKVK